MARLLIAEAVGVEPLALLAATKTHPTMRKLRGRLYTDVRPSFADAEVEARGWRADLLDFLLAHRFEVTLAVRRDSHPFADEADCTRGGRRASILTVHADLELVDMSLTYLLNSHRASRVVLFALSVSGGCLLDACADARCDHARCDHTPDSTPTNLHALLLSAASQEAGMVASAQDWCATFGQPTLRGRDAGVVRGSLPPSCRGIHVIAQRDASTQTARRDEVARATVGRREKERDRTARQ